LEWQTPEPGNAGIDTENLMFFACTLPAGITAPPEDLMQKHNRPSLYNLRTLNSVADAAADAARQQLQRLHAPAQKPCHRKDPFRHPVLCSSHILRIHSRGEAAAEGCTDTKQQTGAFGTPAATRGMHNRQTYVYYS
jgi:hypothetical protein